MASITSHRTGWRSLLFLIALPLIAGPTRSFPASPAAEPMIVQVRTGQHAADVPRDYGLVPDAVWDSAVMGFAARLNAAQVRRLQGDNRVLLIEPDGPVTTMEHGPRRVHAFLHDSTTETLTTGIDRVDADLNPRTDVSATGIAVIDTGIDLDHPDLNVAGGVSFVRGKKSADDDNGHGSHVSGIAAAKTNDNHGVRGVAPNARLYAVKVLDRFGSGQISWVISGINWVTKNAAVNRIQVANMSLGFYGSSSTLNTAIHNSVAAGVTYVVAAGNSGDDASYYSPAGHPDVITVSAMGDSDGACGGVGPPTSDWYDDSFASFSNFGPAVEIGAPGVDILSTYTGGMYATLSGTSMSSPHVAGAAAQYVASNPGATPAQVRAALVAIGTPQVPLACTPHDDDGDGVADHEVGGFTDDTDLILFQIGWYDAWYAEPLVDAARL